MRKKKQNTPSCCDIEVGRVIHFAWSNDISAIPLNLNQHFFFFIYRPLSYHLQYTGREVPNTLRRHELSGNNFPALAVHIKNLEPRSETDSLQAVMDMSESIYKSNHWD